MNPVFREAALPCGAIVPECFRHGVNFAWESRLHQKFAFCGILFVLIDNAPMKLKWIVWCVLAAGVMACSPALNWRTLLVDEAGLQVLLPCKPDRAHRPVEMAGRVVELHMIGCDADGATFAVSHVAWPDPATAPQALAQWQAAVLARMGAAAADTSVPWGGAGSMPMAGSMRIRARGAAPAPGADAGKPVVAEAVWLARVQGPELRLVHAVVYQRGQSQADVADTFLKGVTWQ